MSDERHRQCDEFGTEHKAQGKNKEESCRVTSDGAAIEYGTYTLAFETGDKLVVCKLVWDEGSFYFEDIETRGRVSDCPIAIGEHFETTRIVTKSGTAFFRNSNGIFDTQTGEKRFSSMAEFRRFEAHEKTKRS